MTDLKHGRTIGYLLLLFIPLLSSAEVIFSTHLIHLNDHHSHLVEENYELKFNGVKTKIKLGGFARVAAKIKALRNQIENPLVLHSGDALQGTLYYTLFKGNADVELMNEVHFDAFELGNHEFDDGNAVLADFLNKARFPILAANINFAQSQALKGLVQPYLIKEMDGHQIALIGINTLKTLESSKPSKELIFYNEIETAQKKVQELENRGINKIILMTHYGYDKDQALAKQVAGIDVIVGGDSHTLLGKFTDLGLISEGPYPTQVKSPRGEPVCIVQAWQYAAIVGSLRVGFDEKGTVTECEGHPILLVGDSFQRKNEKGEMEPVDEETQTQIETFITEHPNIEIVQPDPHIIEKLSNYTEQVDRLSKTVIGQAAESLLHIRIPGIHPSGVKLARGSLVAPLVAEAYFEQLTSRNYEVDFVIQNAGGVRSDLSEGDITIETAYTLLPFSNTLYILELTGAEVKQVLEEALSHHFDKGGSDGSFPYAAGIRYTMEVNRPSGQRITLLEMKSKGKCSQWLSIHPKQKYQVGTHSFMASGRDGYTTFGQILNERGGVDTYFDYAESFVNYVKKVGVLKRLRETGLTYIK